jgi:hypothetical protein
MFSNVQETLLKRTWAPRTLNEEKQEKKTGLLKNHQTENDGFEDRRRYNLSIIGVLTDLKI